MKPIEHKGRNERFWVICNCNDTREIWSNLIDTFCKKFNNKNQRICKHFKYFTKVNFKKSQKILSLINCLKEVAYYKSYCSFFKDQYKYTNETGDK